MTTVHSDTEPAVVYIDRIENGIARLLVRWNIVQEDVKNQMTEESRKAWQYSECVIPWTLPQKYESIEDILAYLDTIQDEILNWAMATENTFDGTVTKAAAKTYVLEKVSKAI